MFQVKLTLSGVTFVALRYVGVVQVKGQVVVLKVTSADHGLTIEVPVELEQICCTCQI